MSMHINRERYYDYYTQIIYTNTVQSFTILQALIYGIYALCAFPCAHHESFNREWRIFIFPKYSNSVLLPPFDSKEENITPPEL